MTEKVMPPLWIKEPTGISDMRRLAQRIVDSMPKVQAAILFGSRARNTACRDSDWDVVLLAPQRYKHEVLRTAPCISNVNYVSLSPRQLRERYNRLGMLERSVVRDGILLAGQWNPPNSTKRIMVSYPSMYHRLRTATSHARIAYHQLALERACDSGEVDGSICEIIQNAMKFTSRSALLHLGVDAPEIHNIEKLAVALFNKHTNHPWVSTIRSFSDVPLSRHSEEYDTGDVDICNIAELEGLLCRVLKFHGEVLEDIAKKRPGFRREAIKLCNSIILFVSNARTEKKWKQCPVEVRQSMLLWKESAQRALEGLGGGQRG